MVFLEDSPLGVTMAKGKSQKLKEEFLSTVTGVEKDAILSQVRELKDEDVYTHFITKDAFASGTLEEDDVNEFLLKVYSDWYFLHKNTYNKNIRAVKMLTEYSYTPVKLSEGKAMLNMVKTSNYDDVIPVSLQYLNRVEDKFFIAVRSDILHNQLFANVEYNVRLYINLKIDRVLEFSSILLDRAYSGEFPIIVKILNNDFRCDTITVYTDYAYAKQVVDTINEIKTENSELFSNVGAISPLLGRVNDYIGFGEVDKFETTYLNSRCNALTATEKLAEVEYLRKALMKDEEKVIARSNGKTYTPTEYLEFLITRNAVALIEKRIEEVETNDPKNKTLLNSLREKRDNVWQVIDVAEEVKKLKRSFTRNNNYILEIEGVGRGEFDYITKLYSIFGGKRTSLKPIPTTEKKDTISSAFFKTTETFEGLNTREFLEVYFRTKLSYILQDIIEEETESLYRSKESTTLTRLKKKVLDKLKYVWGLIVDEDDEGKEYLDRYIFDLLRILSTDGLEMVETSIAGKPVPMDTSVPSEMIGLLPLLKDEVKILSETPTFVDNILLGLGINTDNLCLTSSTENVCKTAEKKEETPTYSYYYGRVKEPEMTK